MNTMTVDGLVLDDTTVDGIVAAEPDAVPFHIVMTTPAGTVVWLTAHASYDDNTGLITLDIPAQHGHKAFPTGVYPLSEATTIIDYPKEGDE